VSEWTEIALPILRAVGAWEKSSPPGQVLDDAAVAERLGISGHDPAFRRCLMRLVDEGLLDGQNVGGQISWGLHIRGLTAEGSRALGEWPQLVPIADIGTKRRIRAALVHGLYDATDGDINSTVDLHTLAKELGISMHDAEGAGQYLEDEGLIAFHGVQGMGGSIHLTHAGLREVETGRMDPSRPTQHFPEASQIININAPVHHSQIGQAGSELRQAAGYNAQVGADLVNLTATVRETLAPLEIDDDERRLIDQI
jgi:hypothetical protein